MRNPPPSSTAASNTMRANRGKDTGPELMLRRALRAAGLPGYRLNWSTPAGRIDIAFPGKRLAILVHGCFWHRCPHCDLPLPKSNTEFWRQKFERNIQRDEQMSEALSASGWNVLTVWECRLRQDVDSVVEDVRTRLAM